MSNLTEVGRRGLVDGIVLTATTTVALMAVSKRERGGIWAGMNCVCHIVDGDEREFGDGFDRRDSLLGTVLSSTVMIAWAVIHQLLFGRAIWPKSLYTGLGTSLGAYVIDYYLVPKRFTPGIEKKLSGSAIGFVYLVLGLTLAMMPNTGDNS